MGGKSLQQKVVELLKDCYTSLDVRVVNIQTASSNRVRVHYVVVLQSGLELKLREIMGLIKKQLFGRGHPHSKSFEIKEAFVDTKAWELIFPD